MKLSTYFDPARFWLLLKMELHRSRRAIIMTLVIIFGIHFFLGLLLTPLLEPDMLVFEHASGYAFSLLGGGLILSSLAFIDLGNTLRRYYYLTLPVSTFEKFLSMWLLTSVGWIVVYTALYTVYALIANAVGPALFSYMDFESFNPFGKVAVKSMRYYFVLQGIFLVGAARFKAYVFPKTLFTLILFAAAAGLIAYLMLSNIMSADSECLSDPSFLTGSPVHTLWLIIQWMFWWLLAPLTWVTAYLALKEKEV